MKIEIDLPTWAIEANASLPPYLPNLEQRMEAVIQFARWNTERQTGGPFAAGLFERDSGKRVVVGVNRVMPTLISSAHAEVVTLSLGQRLLSRYDLGGPDQPDYQLVINAQPCAMCCGAILWSGVTSIAFAASGSQVESITGFDEGPVHPDWMGEYQKRGVEVIAGVMAEPACQALRDFTTSGQPIYNARRG